VVSLCCRGHAAASAVSPLTLVLCGGKLQAASMLGISLHSLRKSSRLHNIRRWPFRKIQLSTKRGVKLSEDDILAYCQSEVATDLEGADALSGSLDGGPSSPGGSSDHDHVLATTPSAAAGIDVRWGEVRLARPRRDVILVVTRDNGGFHA
jgi:hypothetical protein